MGRLQLQAKKLYTHYNMLKILANWVVNAFALFLVSRIVQGVHLADFKSAMIAVAVIGLINALIKPVLLLLTLPITILTLGLFTFVINAILFMFAGSLLSGFTVEGFGSAFIGSIVLTIISTLLHSLVKS